MLSEIRKMVEEMQNVNKRLEEMKGDIIEYFKPVDKEVGVLMDMQMEKDKEKMEMMGSMYKQALIEKAETQAAGDVNSANQANMETMSAVFKQALLEKAEAEVAAEMKKSQKEQNLPLSKQDIALWTDWTPSIKRRPSTIANAYQEPCYSQEAFDWEEDGRVCKIKYKE